MFSKPKFDFEQIHPSKKAAFADGALTATVITTLVMYSWNERRNFRAWLEGWNAAEKSYTEHPAVTAPTE